MEESTATASIIATPTMNTIYRDFNDFLMKHTIKKDQSNTTVAKPITNTRIGDPKTNIYGGSYHIPDSEYSTFLYLYNRDILVPKKKEYLTEKQLENGGPLLIDIDLRHDYEVDERQYSKEHIDDLLDSYLGELNKIYQPDENTNIPIFVFEKPSVNRINTEKEKKTKDGIHIIIGLQTDHITQRILRKKMIKNTSEMWSDLPITNTWDDVFDEGISIGFTNWQLYGSRKPNHDRYQLTRLFEVTYDESDGEFMRKELPISSFDIGKNIEKLSVRYKGHQSLFMRNDFIKEYDEFKRINQLGGNGTRLPSSNPNVRLNQLDNLMDDSNAISKISNAAELQMVLNHFLDNVNNTSDYELRDAYEYVNILPASYYEAGSYSKWIRVGWVLRNTSNKLLIVWIAFSAKASNFDYRSIPELCERWRKTDLRKHNGLSKLSLMRWAKNENKEAFEQIRNNTIDFFVEETINKPISKGNERNGCGDWDLANVLYQLYKHEFICVSVKSNIWYQYKDNRWVEIDSGTTLRKAISIELRDLYNKKSIQLMENMTEEENMNSEHQTIIREEKAKPRNVRILNICQRLSNTNDKKNIMTEAKELFYDGSFLAKLDTNPYLLCFKNGVVDFKEKIFRKGQPEDNISMTTNIDYIPINLSIHQPIIDDFNDFMSKIFPEPELCRYMYDHLASTLIGTSANQTFNMYIGAGRNGKSVLVNLMEIILGQYSGIVPLTLVTEKRGKVGGLTPEIVELKGKRYAVMQEPQKGEKMNEGIMKQLTSGKDQLQGRAPYMPQTISFTPQFKLVVCCNNLLEIKSNDYGTWRRIRAVPFKSLFTTDPVQGDKEKPYQFKEDENIGEKFEEWKEVVAALFVQRVFETNGVVKDCDIVLARSNEYRQSQDYISEFIRDCVIRDSDGRIKKMELNNEFSNWYASNYGGRGPSPKDLHEYMDKEFGRNQNQMWSGVKIKYVRDEVDTFSGNTDDEVDDDINSERL
uniref:SF3 helicase domain-containing protein n=1 Tax=viral metagenome TaxID=1070528 RepID=A0A6C0DMA4_9ZZZZ